MATLLYIGMSMYSECKYFKAMGKHRVYRKEGEGSQILLIFGVVTRWMIPKVDTFVQHSFANNQPVLIEDLLFRMQENAQKIGR